jgi:putative ABC transport system permease protein
MKMVTKSVFRKLKRMKGRTVAISLVVSVSMAMLLMGLYGVVVMNESVDTFFEESKMPDAFVTFGEPQNSTEVAAVLDARSDLEAYDMRMNVVGVCFHEGEMYSTLFIGVEDPNNDDINIINLQKGRMFTSPGEAVAITGMENKGIKIGATPHLELGGEKVNVTITGTVTGAEFTFTSAYADYSIPVGGSLVVLILPIEVLQGDQGPVINEVLLLEDDSDGAENAVDALQGFGITAVVYQKDHASRTFLEIGAGKLKAMMPLMSAIFMMIGFISIFMTMMRLVQSDSRYIGVLMAMGYEKRDIVKAYLALGAVIALIGSVLGILLGLWFTKGWMNVATEMFFTGVEMVFPFAPMPFVYSILFAVASVMLSVAIPVYLITRASVREALEYKPRTTVRRTKGSSGRMSKVTVMGLRNTVRNPGRTVITVIVVALTIGVAGSWLIMLDSAMDYMNGQFDADNWDARADFLTPVPTGLVNESYLGLTPSDTVFLETYAFLRGEARSGDDDTRLMIMASDNLTTIRDFDVREGELDFSGAVISNMLADDLKIGPGDDITIVVGSQELDMEIEAVVLDIMGNTVYTSRTRISSLFPTNMSSGAFVKFTASQDVQEKVKDMRSVPQVTKVVVHEDMTDMLGETMEMALGMLYFFFFLMIMITLVVAGSAVIISAMERDVEYATLDTLGVSKWKTAKSILVEMGILGILSAIASIPFAYLFAEIIARLMKDVVFYFPIVPAIQGTILMMVVGMMFVLLSSFVPINYARKLDTEKTIRERTAG